MESLSLTTLERGKTKIDAAALEALAAQLRGTLLREGDASYDEVRSIWNAMIDRRPGLIISCVGASDVVTAVNERPIERPEQAFSAFQSLAVAKELRVTYERKGARREIVYPIDD